MKINGEEIELKDSMISSKPMPLMGDNPAPLPQSWIAALFARLQGRYGHKWISAYPEGEILSGALAEWADGLSGYTGDEIKHGLKTWTADWPPSLPEFKQACRPQGSNDPAHKAFPKLPKPKAHAVVRKEHLRRMREILEN